MSLFFALARTMCPAAEPLSESTALVLAVHPYREPAEITRRFARLADFIARELGQPVTVRIGGSYAEQIDAIGRDQVDIAFLGPSGYVKLLDRFGPKPLLARCEVDHQPNLSGVIAVPISSPLAALAELRGRRFAFGYPESTTGYFVPLFMMVRSGVAPKDLGEYRFLGSQPNVALALLAGDYDAGAMRRDVFEEYAPKGLRILRVMPPTPDHVFVTRGNFPPSRVTRLRSALLTLDRTAEGRLVLADLQPGLTRLIAAAEADYQGLRDMMRAVPDISQ